MYKKEKLIEVVQAQQAGLNEKADKLYKRLLKDCPQAWDVHQKYAIFLVSHGRRKEAIKHFKLISQSNPTHAPSHANLASALAEEGDYDAAIFEFERALVLDSRLVQARLVLLKIYLKTEHFKKAVDTCNLLLDLVEDKAPIYHMAGLAVRGLNEDIELEISCFEKAVQLNNGYFQYHLDYAFTLHRNKSFELAEIEFNHAIDLEPGSLEARTLLFDLLWELKRFTEADAMIKTAISKNPGNCELYEREGCLLISMNRHDEAILAFNNALKIDSKREIALSSMARCYSETGNIAEALNILEKTIDYHPNFVEAYNQYATLKKFDSSDVYAPKILNLINQLGADNKITTGLHFALGKIYDDCKEWDSAFEHYLKANDLANLACQYSPKEFELFIDRNIKIFSYDFVSKYRGYQNSSKTPIFIIGMPRSGTTLTEQIVSSHHLACSAGEVGFWNNFSRKQDWSLPPSSFMSTLETQIQQEAPKYIKHLEMLLDKRDSVFYVTDKFPHNFLNFGLLALIFPNARFIHCNRNSMDTCLSIFFQFFNFENNFSFNLSSIGHHYKQYLRMMKHWEEVFPGKIYNIHYEDLVSDSEYWSRDMISFLGLDWDDACLLRNKSDHVVKTASIWQVRQPIHKASMLKWKNYEKHLGPLKEALGLEDN